jgi:hypothetical protein
VDRVSSAKACNALLIYPRFDADTFWNFKRTAELFGAKYPAPPLGMITLAALLPRFWSLRLVNRNTEQLSDDDLDWADLVLQAACCRNRTTRSMSSISAVRAASPSSSAALG